MGDRHGGTKVVYPSGDYKVEVRAVLNGDPEVRSGELDAVLTVS